MSENKEREAFEAWLATSAQDISDADWTTQGIWLGGYRAALQAGGQPVAWHIGNADGSMSKLGAIYHDRKSAVRHIDSYGWELEACIVPLYAAPAPVGEPAALTDERGAFEDAWRAQYPDHGLTVFLRSLQDNARYTNTRTQDGWLMWQARALLAAQPAAPAQKDGVRWDLFPSWLIDHCEGDTITEEGLQRALADMLKTYPAQPAHPDRQGVALSEREFYEAMVHHCDSNGYPIEPDVIDSLARLIANMIGEK